MSGKFSRYNAFAYLVLSTVLGAAFQPAIAGSAGGVSGGVGGGVGFGGMGLGGAGFGGAGPGSFGFGGSAGGVSGDVGLSGGVLNGASPGVSGLGGPGRYMEGYQPQLPQGLIAPYYPAPIGGVGGGLQANGEQAFRNSINAGLYPLFGSMGFGSGAYAFGGGMAPTSSTQAPPYTSFTLWNREQDLKRIKLKKSAFVQDYKWGHTGSRLAGRQGTM